MVTLDVVYICSRTNMTRAFRPPQQKSSLSFTVVPSENNLKHFLRITKIITFYFLMESVA